MEGGWGQDDGEDHAMKTCLGEHQSRNLRGITKLTRRWKARCLAAAVVAFVDAGGGSGWRRWLSL